MYLRNKKSRKKWQKTFINDVFKKKTKFHDTFSKIILSNLDLLEFKKNHLPTSLFKFYKPTSDNIIDIKKQRLWLSHPSIFNDPFDCQTGYDVNEYEKKTLLSYIKTSGFVNPNNSKNGFTSDEFNRLSKSTTSYEYYNSKIEEYDTVLRKLLESKDKDFNSKIFNLIRESNDEVKMKMDKLININIRVTSFSALNRFKGFDNIIHMWSHYADNHKGLCVEYNISSLNEPSILSLKDHEFYTEPSRYMNERIKAAILGGLFPVIYTANRVNIPTTKLKKIKPNKINGLQHNIDIDAILYKTYIVKSSKWSYEKEWRIILDGSICDYYDNKIPFPYIKRIYLGCKMSSQTIDTMIEIAEDLGVEVKMMSMDSKKFILEEHGIDSYKWNKERMKWRSPFF